MRIRAGHLIVTRRAKGSDVGIAARIGDALQKVSAGDAEGALFHVCAAIEATAHREGRGRGRAAYKAFLSDNVGIITGVTLGTYLSGLKVEFSHPELHRSKSEIAAGPPGIEEFVYCLMRCSLYHTTELSSALRLTSNKIGTDSEGYLLLPRSLVIGLIVAVVVSPANADEQIESSYSVGFLGNPYVVNDLWGQREAVVALFQEAAYAKRGPSTHA